MNKKATVSASKIIDVLNLIKTPAFKVKANGETRTNSALIDDMLNYIPDNIWAKGGTFLDPCCGRGTFLIKIIDRLLPYHKPKDIVEMIRGVDIDSHCVYTTKEVLAKKLNVTSDQLNNIIVQADYVNWNPKMKFDVVIGNPPFQKAADGDKRDAAANLWPEFVVKAFEELVKDDGYVGFVSPNGWMTPSADKGKGESGIRIYDYMTKYQTLALNINECKKHFAEGSSFTYYVIQKTPNQSHQLTKIITTEDTFETDLSNVKYCPSIFNPVSLSLNAKVLSSGLPVIGFTNNNTGPGKLFADDIVEEHDAAHPVKCYHSSADDGTYVYSSKHLPEVNKRKVMVCSSGNYLPVYDSGNIGFTYKIYVYYLAERDTLDSIKSYLSSKLVHTILNQNKTSGWVSYAFRLLPKIDFTKIWTDAELYKLFNLTQQEIDYIESTFE